MYGVQCMHERFEAASNPLRMLAMGPPLYSITQSFSAPDLASAKRGESTSLIGTWLITNRVGGPAVLEGIGPAHGGGDQAKADTVPKWPSGTPRLD